MNLASEAKKLAIQLRENEDSYVTGRLDLNEILDKQDSLWSEVEKKSDRITANEITPDSDLMKLQTGVARKSARCFKPDSLVFNPVDFSIKLGQYYDNYFTSNDSAQSSSKAEELLWLELGNVAKKLLYTVPSFNFIYGTFDPDPAEIVKKKRKMKEKDKVGDLTKPLSMNLSESCDEKDPAIKEAERVLGILVQLRRKNEDNVVCFYEFVTDPTSFVRTVENIFTVALLVKEGCVRIVKDRNGLPCISLIDDKDRDGNSESKQCILSVNCEEWKKIVKTFNLKKPLIPPRRSTAQR